MSTPIPGLFETWADLVKTVGVPAAALLLVLWQLVPRIDHAIELGEHIDGRITVIATYCAPVSAPRTSSP